MQSGKPWVRWAGGIVISVGAIFLFYFSFWQIWLDLGLRSSCMACDEAACAVKGLPRKVSHAHSLELLSQLMQFLLDHGEEGTAGGRCSRAENQYLFLKKLFI